MALIPDWPEAIHPRRLPSSALQASSDGLLGQTMRRPAELSESTAGETQQQQRQNKYDTSPKALSKCMHFFWHYI